MKQKVKTYSIYLFGKDEEFCNIEQEKGQKIIMAIAQNNPPKFILVNGELIATSSISKVCFKSMWQYGGDEVRELTKSEEDTQKKFLEFNSKGKLLLE